MKTQEVQKLYQIGNEAVKEYLKKKYPAILNTKKFKIGTVLKRKSYPASVYALFKHDGFVRLLNIAGNRFWKEDNALRVHTLTDPDREYLTFMEFKELTKSAGVREDDFYEVNI